jgi:hypothetical protein
MLDSWLEKVAAKDKSDDLTEAFEKLSAEELISIIEDGMEKRAEEKEDTEWKSPGKDVGALIGMAAGAALGTAAGRKIMKSVFSKGKIPSTAKAVGSVLAPPAGFTLGGYGGAHAGAAIRSQFDKDKEKKSADQMLKIADAVGRILARSWSVE